MRVCSQLRPQARVLIAGEGHRGLHGQVTAPCGPGSIDARRREADENLRCCGGVAHQAAQQRGQAALFGARALEGCGHRPMVPGRLPVWCRT